MKKVLILIATLICATSGYAAFGLNSVTSNYTQAETDDAIELVIAGNGNWDDAHSLSVGNAENIIVITEDISSVSNQVIVLSNQVLSVSSRVAALEYELPTVAFTSAGDTYETGRTISSVNLDFTVNKEMSGRSYSGTYAESLGAGGSYSYTYETPITTSSSFSISVIDDESATAFASKLYSFKNRTYYGKSSAETLGATDPRTMSAAWEARGHSGTISDLDNEYIYVSYPSRLGECSSFTLGGFPTDAWDLQTIFVLNSYGASEEFYIYRTEYKQTGDMTYAIN